MHNLRTLRFHLQGARYRLCRSRCIQTCLYHRRVVSGLVQWATRQRRTKQHRYYQSSHDQIEQSLFWQRYRNRRLVLFCQRLFELRQMLGPQRRYRPAGSAARYQGRM